MEKTDQLFFYIARGDLINVVVEYTRIKRSDEDLAKRILNNCIRDARYSRNALILEYFNDQ